jgi:hypothetical protein
MEQDQETETESTESAAQTKRSSLKTGSKPTLREIKKDIKPAEWLEKALSQPEIQQSIVKAIADSLSAVKHQWDGKRQQADEVPDYATRIKAAELALSYIVGRPVERQQIMVAHQKMDDPVQLVKSSPALRVALKELLEEGDEKRSN